LIPPNKLYSSHKAKSKRILAELTVTIHWNRKSSV